MDSFEVLQERSSGLLLSRMILVSSDRVLLPSLVLSKSRYRLELLNWQRFCEVVICRYHMTTLNEAIRTLELELYRLRNNKNNV